jgi:hypothetical protein
VVQQASKTQQVKLDLLAGRLSIEMDRGMLDA